MDSEEDEFSATAAVLAEDDGADVSAVFRAHGNVLIAVRRRARARRIARRLRYRGSTTGRRGSKRRDFAAGLQAILRDYFGFGGLPPIYDERDFETRFRVPRAVFRRVYMAVKDEPFFQQRINAKGKLQEHPLQKVMASFRVIAYGEAADRADEYVRLSRTVISTSTKLLMEFIVKRWGPKKTEPGRAERDHGAEEGAGHARRHRLSRLLSLGVAPIPDGDGGGVPKSQGQARHCRRSCL